MKRSFFAFIMILAVLSGLPEAARQYRSVRESGASWLRNKMVEGFTNSAGSSGPSPDQRRCEPVPSNEAESASSNADGTESTVQLIGRVNLGANIYVAN